MQTRSPSELTAFGAALSVALRKPIGQSNLDLTGRRIVKRGSVVSWYGARFKVARVRQGVCYPSDGSPAFVPCSSVQVVA